MRTLYMKPIATVAGGEVSPERLCQVHSMPIDELMSKFIGMLSASHGSGGTNVCTECIHRMKQEADRRRSGGA